jgi:hypothetical protein
MDGSLLLCPFCNLLLVCLEMRAKGIPKFPSLCREMILACCQILAKEKHSQVAQSILNQQHSSVFLCFFFYQSCNLKQSKADYLACSRTELSIKNRLLWVIWKKESKDCHSLSDMNCKFFESFLLDGSPFLTHENDMFICDNGVSTCGSAEEVHGQILR